MKQDKINGYVSETEKAELMNGEMGEEDLENVSGGFGAIGLFVAGVIMVVGGCALQTFGRR